MSTHAYYYYASGPKDDSGTAYPNYSPQLGYMNFTGFRFAGVDRESLESGLEGHLGSARTPVPGQMMIVRLTYTQNDVSYFSHGYSSIDGSSISVYMPMTNAGVGESDSEPWINFVETTDVYDLGYVSLNGSEEDGIFIKYGGMPSYYTVKNVIDNYLVGPSGIVTQMYTSILTRENIPNVIKTNLKQEINLDSMSDEASTRASNFTISTAGTTTSY